MIADYLNINIIEELGLSNLSTERKNELLEQMLEVVEQRIFVLALERLPEEKKKDLDKLLDDEEGDIQDFLIKELPNYESLVQEIIANYKKETMEMFAAVNI